MQRTTTILQPATSTALTTVAAVKDEIQVTGTTDDSYITRRVTLASADIAARCGRSFGRELVQDVFSLDPWGRDPVFARPPLRDVRPLSLSRDLLDSVVSVASQGVPIDPTLWSAELGAGLLYHMTPLGRTHWTTYPVTVVFWSGWYLPGDSAPNLHPSVEDVCLDMVVRAYTSRGRDPDISDELVEGAGRIKYKDVVSDEIDVRLAPFVVRQ